MSDLFELNHEAFEDWREWRRTEKRAKITPRSEKMQHRFLQKYPAEIQAEIIEHSMMNGYQGLFPPKGRRQNINPGERSTRDISLIESLTDTSWADGVING